jgi:hypothetical protein
MPWRCQSGPAGKSAVRAATVAAGIVRLRPTRGAAGESVERRPRGTHVRTRGKNAVSAAALAFIRLRSAAGATHERVGGPAVRPAGDGCGAARAYRDPRR